MIVRKVRIFYCVSILSTFCLLSLLNFWGQKEQQIVSKSAFRATEKVHSHANEKTDDGEIINNPDIKLPTLPQYKETIKVALEEIEASARTISADELANPKVLFLVSTWRSGSTFLGEAISAHQTINYHYEPLSRFGFQNLEIPTLEDESLQMMESLSQCQYSKLHQYLEFVQKNDTNMLQLNSKIRRACKFLSDDCYNVDFLSKSCSYFPIQLFKVVRLHVAAFEKFLKNDPQAHLIVLTRDPRAIFASRKQLPWCMDNKRCGDPDELCQTLKTNLASTKALKITYPNQVHLVKYEELARDATTVLKNIFADLQIGWSKNVDDYLNTHTSTNLDESWSTFRISKLRINHWKDASQLEPSMIEYLQNKCDTFMAELNYPLINVKLCDKFC